MLRAFVLVLVGVSVGSSFAIGFFGSKKNYQRSSNESLLHEHKSNVFNESDNSIRNCQIIRDAVVTEFPEIETVYSDDYLEWVAGVPNRTMDHAISKIKRALGCRRSYQVDALLHTFEAVPANEMAGKVFVPRAIKNHQIIFDPSPQLVKVCASCAFVVLDEELEDRDNGETCGRTT